MKTQGEVETMFQEVMGLFISSCEPENTSDVSNILVKMISLSSIAFTGLVQDEKLISDLFNDIRDYAIKKKGSIKLVQKEPCDSQTKH